MIDSLKNQALQFVTPRFLGLCWFVYIPTDWAVRKGAKWQISLPISASRSISSRASLMVATRPCCLTACHSTMMDPTGSNEAKPQTGTRSFPEVGLECDWELLTKDRRQGSHLAYIPVCGSWVGCWTRMLTDGFGRSWHTSSSPCFWAPIPRCPNAQVGRQMRAQPKDHTWIPHAQPSSLNFIHLQLHASLPLVAWEWWHPR